MHFEEVRACEVGPSVEERGLMCLQYLIMKRRPPWCEAVETSEEVGPRASGSSECGKEKERARMALDRVGAGGEEVTASSEPEGPMKALS